jgi:hypothetical protein
MTMLSQAETHPDKQHILWDECNLHIVCADDVFHGRVESAEDAKVEVLLVWHRYLTSRVSTPQFTIIGSWISTKPI